jgi:hypothetical protein
VSVLAAEGTTVPLYVPLVFAAWGLFIWLIADRQMVRDPRGEFRKMAEKRARSRVVRLLGGSGDPEVEFQQLWRTRWLWPAVALLYVAVVLLFGFKSLAGWSRPMLPECTSWRHDGQNAS